MKKITEEEIAELLTIIPRNYPSHDIFHLTNCCNTLCESLQTLCQDQGYLYELAIIDDICFEEMNQNSLYKPHKFDFNKNRYNRHSRMYEFVFVTIDLKEIAEVKNFYKKLYAISKNAGTLIFIVDNAEDLRTLEETLIEHNYVAVNPIINTFKNYQILSAHKMHGWGN